MFFFLPNIGLRHGCRALLLSLLVAASLCDIAVAQAESYTFLFTDKNGDPLKDAVLLLEEKIVARQEGLPVAVMDQVDKQFLPEVLVVAQGQRVSFPNSDNIRHHVYSFSEAKPFELKLYAGTPDTSVLFDKPGIVILGCNIHDSMIGYIVVSGGPANVSGEDGMLAIESQAAISNVRVWHPQMGPGVVMPIELSLPAPNARQQYPIQLDVLSPKPVDKEALKKRYRKR